jgi:uncharacterized protein (TIGR03083 family)
MTNVTTGDVILGEEIADECCALADLLEVAPPEIWDALSLCEGWRTREVVAHMTMPVRYPGPRFMSELEAAGGDFTRLSNTVAARDGELPPAALLAGLRSDVLHAWRPPGGGAAGALVHCVIHGLDITEATGLGRTVPGERTGRVLSFLTGSDSPNPFAVDLTGVQLHADDLAWSYGSGEVVSGPAQVLALVVCGRAVPSGRLRGRDAERFTQR